MEPLRTAEARWFVRGPISPALWAWFDALGEPVEAESRTDRYLAPTDDGLGVKLREGHVEAKRREGTAGRLAMGRAEATIEAWAKWSFPLADTPDVGESWVEVAKTRRQRSLTASGGTCRIELSEVTVGTATWASVCLEADGPTALARRAALLAGARRWLDAEAAPTLPAAAARGYAAWLREVAETR
ncbi:hypothetical protein [Rubrivirga sp.]|uniref:hypothetical protein n=1 Tax=Rubrivirga sp. TaxID=1885344 RepID=UPI003B51BB87